MHIYQCNVVYTNELCTSITSAPPPPTHTHTASLHGVGGEGYRGIDNVDKVTTMALQKAEAIVEERIQTRKFTPPVKATTSSTPATPVPTGSEESTAKTRQTFSSTDAPKRAPQVSSELKRTAQQTPEVPKKATQVTAESSKSAQQASSIQKKTSQITAESPKSAQQTPEVQKTPSQIPSESLKGAEQTLDVQKRSVQATTESSKSAQQTQAAAPTGRTVPAAAESLERMTDSETSVPGSSALSAPRKSVPSLHSRPAPSAAKQADAELPKGTFSAEQISDTVKASVRGKSMEGRRQGSLHRDVDSEGKAEGGPLKRAREKSTAYKDIMQCQQRHQVGQKRDTDRGMHLNYVCSCNSDECTLISLFFLECHNI